MSTERVVAVRAIAPALKSALHAILSSGEPGVRAGKGGKLGALFNVSAAERLVGMIKEAKEQGAELVVGDGSRDGAVVQPHLITGVKSGTSLWEEEQFGPGAYAHRRDRRTGRG